MTVREFSLSDLPALVDIWNLCVNAGEVVYRPLTEAYFKTKFLGDPNHNPRYCLVAEQDGVAVGFIYGLCKKIFLAKETHENTPGFLTLIMVHRALRRRGIGNALLTELSGRFRADGKRTIAVSGLNPLNIDWIVPGTPGHDHNNAPGIDTDCDGYNFLVQHGFAEHHREVAMYLNLADYVWKPEISQLRTRLAWQGIFTGRYDPWLDYDYDGMCDRIPSEYWRSSIATEIASWKACAPTTDIRFLPNGKVPEGPRPLIVATHEKKIVAFTGPIDLQDSGRGFFTGICTDPLYEKRGIATVMFNLLMREFVEEGATFSTLFTAATNHAQRLYERTGFRVAKRFAMMERAL